MDAAIRNVTDDKATLTMTPIHRVQCIQSTPLLHTIRKLAIVTLHYRLLNDASDAGRYHLASSPESRFCRHRLASYQSSLHYPQSVDGGGSGFGAERIFRRMVFNVPE